MAGLSEADGFLEDTILASCGERVDKALLSELKFNQFQVRGSSFEPFQLFCARFCPGRGVLPLAAASRQKDPRTSSQLDVSLPMKETPFFAAIATSTPFVLNVCSKTMGRVSPDDRAPETPSSRECVSPEKAPEAGGVSLAKSGPCLSAQTLRRQAYGL